MLTGGPISGRPGLFHIASQCDTRTAGFTYDLLVSARPGEYEPKHRMDLHHFAIKCNKENALQHMKTYESCEVCEKL